MNITDFIYYSNVAYIVIENTHKMCTSLMYCAKCTYAGKKVTGSITIYMLFSV